MLLCGSQHNDETLSTFPVQHACAVMYLLVMQRKAALACQRDGAMAAGRKSDKKNRNGISARNYSIVTLTWSIACTYVNVNTTKKNEALGWMRRGVRVNGDAVPVCRA